MIKTEIAPEITRDSLLLSLDHEIRTSVNAILGMTEILSDAHLDSAQKKYLNVARLSAARLLQQSCDILDLFRIEFSTLQLRSEPFNLYDTVRQTVDLMGILADQKGVKIDLELATEARRAVSGEPQRLQQILVTLLRSAVGRMEMGDITLRVRCSPASVGVVELQFDIACSGIVTPPPPPSDTNLVSGQTSLDTDLMLARGLAGMMDGTMRFETPPADPTFCFTVKLPCAQMPEPVGPVKPRSIHPTGRTFRLLIAEDAEDNLLLIEAYLKGGPYAIDSAVNGKVAVDKAIGGAYDLILMDLDMPVMDGRTATRMIRVWECAQERRAVPIVALTAQNHSGAALKSVEAGCTAHVTKPIGKAALIETIHRYASSYT